ncbi:MAG: hypothetical protein KME08_03705 [Aphanothece sp. CMT-3BRIN-NPC111]|nr:hypothetical protein [Aphanothece sp. CMT-3BRIN-NPC111]
MLECRYWNRGFKSFFKAAPLLSLWSAELVVAGAGFVSPKEVLLSNLQSGMVPKSLAGISMASAPAQADLVQDQEVVR